MNLAGRITLLSLAAVTVMSGAAVAPALAAISAVFPSASPTTIKLILTLPAAAIMVVSLAAAQLARVFSKKGIVVAGLVLFLVAGAGGGIAPDLYVLLGFRLLLGVAVGLIMPVSQALIADFFAGEERARMMGYSASSANIGGIVGTLLAGALTIVHWRMAFSVYLLAVLVLVAVTRSLPTAPKPETSKTRPALLPLPDGAGLAALVAVLFSICSFVIPTDIALVLRDRQIGGPDVAGLCFAVLTAGGFVAGVTLRQLRGFAGRWLPLLSVSAFLVGSLLLYLGQNLVTLLPGVALSGLGSGTLFPLIMLLATRSADPSQSVTATAVVTSGFLLGQFLSPLAIGGVVALIGLDGSGRGFLAVTICLCAGWFVVLARTVVGTKTPFSRISGSRQSGATSRERAGR
jgi:MFS family permease